MGIRCSKHWRRAVARNAATRYSTRWWWSDHSSGTILGFLAHADHLWRVRVGCCIVSFRQSSPYRSRLRAELNSARAEAEAARLRVTTQAHEITDGQRKFERTEADLVKARAELYSLRGELRARKEQEAAESNEREALAEKLRSAPKLWVEYKPKEMTDPLGTEFFVFDKEGTAAIKNIQAGPLTWTIQKAYPIAFLSALGPLREQPVECRISVSELIDGNTQLHQVSQLVRKMAKEHGQTLQPYVDFSYEDFDGNRFLQRFVLSIDSYEKIVLEPTGPVTFRNAAPERDLQTGA